MCIKILVDSLCHDDTDDAMTNATFCYPNFSQEQDLMKLPQYKENPNKHRALPSGQEP